MSKKKKKKGESNVNHGRKAQVSKVIITVSSNSTICSITSDGFNLRLRYTAYGESHKSTKKQNPQEVWCQGTQ